MKHLLLLMGPGGMKKPKDTTLQPRSLRRLHPVSVPTMAWTVLLLGVLAYSSGERKGLHSWETRQSRVSGGACLS